MKLHYYRDTYGNFGDELNVPIWRRFLPGILQKESDHLFLGIGTLLNDRLPSASRYTVFGSGAGYGSAPVLDDRWNISFVRGPITAKALGLSTGFAITDPALLVRDLLTVLPDNKRQGVLFIPHHLSSSALDWKTVARRAGLQFVEPSDPPLLVAERIRNAAVVVTEAMHGAIIADALRTPWFPVRTGPHINTEKWRDWTSTVKLSAAFTDLHFSFDTNHFDAVRWAVLSARRSMRLGRPSPFRFDRFNGLPEERSSADEVVSALADVAASARQSGVLSDGSLQNELLSALREQIQLLKSTRRHA